MKLGDGVGREPAPDVATYTYAGMGYANPHAVTQLSSGYSTSTFLYDNDGNVAQKTTDGTTTTYIWDYANRLIALGSGGATTTYGYDAFGTRVYQIVATTSTTTYPFKYFSVASTTKASTNYATSTEYVFNGDTLLATVDQGFKNGSATGTAQTRYIHPDHLGSTNIVTDASGTVVQTLDYYPYGATRVSQSTGGADSARKYIDQFADASGLNYLQARYQDPQRGQFISQDPVFWELGQTDDGKTALTNPQAQNSYGYSNDNPITGKDPNGRCPICVGLYALLSPQVVGDPVFNADGTISDTPQQAALSGGVFVGGFLSGGGEAKVVTGAAKATYSVYQGVDSAGVVRYVGMTGRDALERFGEHLGSVGSGKENLTYRVLQGSGNLLRNDARVMEQSYINSYGLQRNGGALLNKINSVSQSSSLYSSVKAVTSGGGGGGGGSSPALVGLYQSLVSTLQSIVNVLSGR